MAEIIAKEASHLLRNKNRIAIFLFIAALAVYANTFRNGYVLDDNAVIVRNTIVKKGISAIPQIFSTPYLRGFVVNPNDLYRPLSLAMFAAEYQLFGGNPMVGHIINVLLFAGCVVALFFFLDALFEGRQTTVAFIATLLFALHPIHTEVVANIKSRDELLCFFWAFLSLNTFIKYATSGKPVWVIAGFVCYFLSLISKETSASFIIVVPVIFFFYKSASKRRSIIITACVTAGFAGFMILRTSVLNAYGANHPFQVGVAENALVAAPNTLSRIATTFCILGYYIKQLLLPYPLISDHSYNSIPFLSFGNITVLVSFAVYASLFAACIYLLFKRKKNPLAFAILFFLATLVLVSNLFFLVGAAAAERFLFFPSVGYCLAVGILIGFILKRWSTKKIALRLIMFLLILLCGVYVFIDVHRNAEWVNAQTLFRADIARSPNGYRLPYYLGTELINAGTSGDNDSSASRAYLEEGISFLKKSKNIYPALAVVYAELGSAYLTLAQYDSVARYGEMAIKLDPLDTFTMNKLAGVYFKQGQFPESIQLCKRIISIDSSYARGYRNIGACYLKMEKYDSAIAALKIAVRIDPGTPSAYGFLAIAYDRLGNIDSVGKYEAIIKMYNPDFKLR